MACAERGITHMECLANLDKLVGPRRFRSTYWPLLIVMPTKVGIHVFRVCRCKEMDDRPGRGLCPINQSGRALGFAAPTAG